MLKVPFVTAGGLSVTSLQQKAEKMKRILFTVCMLLGCVLFTMAQEDSYKIEGKLGNTVNGKLLLVANTDKGMLDIGEATVTNGEFEFTGRMSETTHRKYGGNLTIWISLWHKKGCKYKLKSK